nr:class I SAM-dependent methyltransferase [Hyphomicrobiales bacterium]
KNDLINWLAPPKRGPYALLDVAGGTGDVSRRFLDATGPEASATICDISAEMLDVGRSRLAASFGDRISFVEDNAEALPFPDKSFDAYTIAFGIRNVTHIDKALSEAHRVLKRGGRFICLEFSHVTSPIIDKVYDAFSFNVIPRIGELVTKDAESYRYLVESIRKFPDQDSFAGMISGAGFERVQYRNLSSGIAALHSGWRI